MNWSKHEHNKWHLLIMHAARVDIVRTDAGTGYTWMLMNMGMDTTRIAYLTFVHSHVFMREIHSVSLPISANTAELMRSIWSWHETHRHTMPLHAEIACQVWPLDNGISDQHRHVRKLISHRFKYIIFSRSHQNELCILCMLCCVFV